MTENEIPIQFVRNELAGNAGEAELKALRSNLPAWRQHLIELARDIDNQILERKTASMKRAINRPDARAETIADYNTWKIPAVRFKSKITSRLGEIKQLMHQNMAKNETRPHAEILEDILEELRFIGDLLSKEPRA